LSGEKDKFAEVVSVRVGFLKRGYRVVELKNVAGFHAPEPELAGTRIVVDGCRGFGRVTITQVLSLERLPVALPQACMQDLQLLSFGRIANRRDAMGISGTFRANCEYLLNVDTIEAARKKLLYANIGQHHVVRTRRLRESLSGDAGGIHKNNGIETATDRGTLSLSGGRDLITGPGRWL
jgi:hypothetical protein